MQSNPAFLDLEEILELHRFQIERYGGEPGIRDKGLLQSALAMPQAGFGDQYLHQDLPEMGAAYLFHIVQNHPFFDGNKRTGTDAALTFLKMNGVLLTADPDALAEMTLSVAKGNLQKAGVAAFFKKHCR